MRGILQGIVFSLVVLLLAALGFFVWASAGTLAGENYAVITTYDAPFATPRDTFTVMTYNLGYLSGMTNNLPVARTAALFAENMETAAALIRRAGTDLVAFQEIDFGAQRSYDVHQLDALALRGGFAASASVVNWDEHYVPFPSANPLMHFGRVVSGQAVLSRYPVLGQERVVLERPSAPCYYDAFYLDRLAQVVEVDLGRPLVLINVHLEAWDTATRERQAGRVRALYQRYAAVAPVLLLGDFNSLLPASKQSPLLSPDRRAYFSGDRTLETLLQDTGLREAFPDSLYRTRDDASFTYPADAPAVKIDHVFYDPGVIEVADAYVADGPDQPSDHRAVVVRLVFKD